MAKSNGSDGGDDTATVEGRDAPLIDLNDALEALESIHAFAGAGAIQAGIVERGGRVAIQRVLHEG